MLHRQHSTVWIKSLIDMTSVIIVETDLRGIRRCARCRRQQLDRYFRTSNYRAALIRTLLHLAILTDRFREWTDLEVTH